MSIFKDRCVLRQPSNLAFGGSHLRFSGYGYVLDNGYEHELDDRLSNAYGSDWRLICR
jgi:hypothetical protein